MRSTGFWLTLVRESCRWMRRRKESDCSPGIRQQCVEPLTCLDGLRYSHGFVGFRQAWRWVTISDSGRDKLPSDGAVHGRRVGELPRFVLGAPVRDGGFQGSARSVFRENGLPPAGPSGGVVAEEGSAGFGAFVVARGGRAIPLLARGSETLGALSAENGGTVSRWDCAKTFMVGARLTSPDKAKMAGVRW